MTQERYEKLRSINSQFPPESNSIHFSTLYFLVMLNHIILTNLVVSLVACGEDVAKYDINGVTVSLQNDRFCCLATFTIVIIFFIDSSTSTR